MNYLIVSLFCSTFGYILGAFAYQPRRIKNDTIVKYSNRRGDQVYARTVGKQYEGSDYVVVQSCDKSGVPIGVVYTLDNNRISWTDEKGKQWTDKVFNA